MNKLSFTRVRARLGCSNSFLACGRCASASHAPPPCAGAHACPVQPALVRHRPDPSSLHCTRSASNAAAHGSTQERVHTFVGNIGRYSTLPEAHGTARVSRRGARKPANALTYHSRARLSRTAAPHWADPLNRPTPGTTGWVNELHKPHVIHKSFHQNGGRLFNVKSRNGSISNQIFCLFCLITIDVVFSLVLDFGCTIYVAVFRHL